MQIHCLHKDLYKLYSLVVSEKIKTDYKKLCEEQVKQWEQLLKHFAGIERNGEHIYANIYKCKLLTSISEKDMVRSYEIQAFERL